MDVVEAIEKCGSEEGKPSAVVRIADCGVVEDEEDKKEDEETKADKDIGREEEVDTSDKRDEDEVDSDNPFRHLSAKEKKVVMEVIRLMQRNYLRD